MCISDFDTLIRILPFEFILSKSESSYNGYAYAKRLASADNINL